MSMFLEFYQPKTMTLGGPRRTDIAGGGPILERIEEARLKKLSDEREAEDSRLAAGKARRQEAIGFRRDTRAFSRSLVRNRAAL